MIAFHPTYSRAEIIHRQILAHIDTIRLPSILDERVYNAPYRWIDIMTVSTAVYLDARNLSDKQVTKEILGFTQNMTDDIICGESRQQREWFTLLTKGKITAEFVPYNGTIRVMAQDFLIDLFDCTLKPVRFDDLISDDTIQFHAARLQSQLAYRQVDVLPSVEDIQNELKRATGINLGLYVRQVPTQLTLFEGVMPITIHYMPNGVINNIGTMDLMREHLELLREVSKNLEINANDTMPCSYSLSYFHLSTDNWSGKDAPISVSIQITMQFNNLTNLLAETIEVRHANGSGQLPHENKSAYLAGEPAAIAELAEHICDHLQIKMDEEQRKVKTTLKRRRTKFAQNKGEIRIDRVSQAVLKIIDKLNPEKGQAIREGRIKNFKLRIDEGGEFFAGHPPRKDHKINRIMVSFRVRDGEFHVRVELSDDHLWENDRLIIHSGMPEVMVASLKGRPANEIIDHPIAAMLGPVKVAQNVARRTEIRFEKIIDNMAYPGD